MSQVAGAPEKYEGERFGHALQAQPFAQRILEGLGRRALLALPGDSQLAHRPGLFLAGFDRRANGSLRDGRSSRGLLRDRHSASLRTGGFTCRASRRRVPGPRTSLGLHGVDSGQWRRTAPPWKPRSDGSQRRRLRPRCASGGSLLRASVSFRFDRMAPELISQCGQHLGPVRILLPRPKPRQQRERDHRRGDVSIDGLLDRPATLT